MRVIVGISGGVDSAVAALLLKEQGHEVMGVFMKNWEEEDSEFCSAEEDSNDARQVCEQLDIPFYTFNFEKEYFDNVFKQFLEAFKKGYTPNPDVLCNREIKFKTFLNQALKLKADKIATGHYARIESVKASDGSEEWNLLKGLDPNKDQSYFLCALGQKELSKAIFPIGEIQKDEVRKIAKKNNLHIHDKKDSTGICFIGERKFRDFLGQFIPAQPGEIHNLEGEVVGQHPGSMYFTIGQREGLGIGGPGGAWYVVDKDVIKNILYVTQGVDHPRLFRSELWATDFTWINGTEPELPLECTAKIRYRQSDQEATLVKAEDGKYLFSFKEPQRAVTKGQYIVVYKGSTCLGGGVII